MSSTILLIVLFFHMGCASALTNESDASALQALKSEWIRVPASWKGSDPCGTNWLGVTCSNNRVISIEISNLGLEGKLTEDISALSELQILLFDGNRFTGNIPHGLGLLTKLQVLYLGNNKLTGGLPSLTNLTSLRILDVSNNTLESSFIPTWISSLRSLSTLRMEGIQLEGPIPVLLFSPIHLRTVMLKGNRINATLEFGTNCSKQLEVVDLRNNSITEYKPAASKRLQVRLADNPVCLKVRNKPSYCSAVQDISSFAFPLIDCPPCGHGKQPSPACHCVYPFTGTLYFRAPSFNSNSTNFFILQKGMVEFLKSFGHPVDTVVIKNPRSDEKDHKLIVDIGVFPLGKDSFTQMAMTLIGFVFSNHEYKAPEGFGPYTFKADMYHHFSDGGDPKSSHRDLAIGLAAGASFLLLLLTIAGVYALMQKKRAERATSQNNPFATWDTSTSSVDAPRLMGARSFSFTELRRCTENFSEANIIGGGGYGKVYKGVLPTGELIAIKRAKQESLRGDLEFKTEVEVLSRLHHRNVVKLMGFCFDQKEQMLVYEYLPNGSLRDSLSGKSGIHLDWERRIQVALGASKGLDYLHEHADPPIIHRDVKSDNVLLDESLSAKVADFGLSKLVGAAHDSTQMKGTMGYMDPDYFMKSIVSTKNDVYAFGVMMLELVTSKTPIVNGEHVVVEVKKKLDKSKTLYALQELLDSTITTSGESLLGFEQYLDLALRCVEKDGDDRPSMGEVVENLMKLV